MLILATDMKLIKISNRHYIGILIHTHTHIFPFPMTVLTPVISVFSNLILSSDSMLVFPLSSSVHKF